MFGGDNKPAPSPKTLGIQDNRGASNEQAIPVPYVNGIARLGVKWLSDPFDITTVAVQSQTGKDSTGVAGYNYYASIAALVCSGAVDGIAAVIMNQDKVWGVDGPYTTITAKRGPDNPDYFDFTIPGFCEARIYWGTETQLPDPYLTFYSQTLIPNSSISEQHPQGVTRTIKHTAYRGFCYIVFKKLFLGFDQTSFQNIEVVVLRQAKPVWLKPITVAIGNDVNPIATIGDLLQHPRQGVGATDDKLNTDLMLATATRLNTENLGVSVYLTDSTPAKDVLTDLFKYFDGIADTNDAGLFGVGLCRPPTGDIPVIDATMWTARPTFDNHDWSETASTVSVSFSDSTIDLDKNLAPLWRNPANYSMNELRPATMDLDRPFFTRPDLAAMAADAAGRAASVPPISGGMPLRLTGTLYADLAPGSVFKFSYPDRNLGHLTFRVQERKVSDPAQAGFSITYKADLSYLYPVPVEGDESGGDADRPGGDPLDNASPHPSGPRIIELPLALCPEGKLSLAVLTARSDVTVVGFGVHLSKNYAGTDTSYAPLVQQQRFALRGVLVEDFSAAVHTISEDEGLMVQLSGVDLQIDDQTFFDALADQLLVFLDDEILSVREAVLIAPGSYQLFCVRARFCSARQDHAAGADVYVVYAGDLTPLQHPSFQPGNVALVKIAPRTSTNTTDLSTVDPIEVDIAGRIYQQTPPENVRVNGASRAASFHSGDGVQIDWSLTESGRDYYQAGLLNFSTIVEFLDGDGTVLGSTSVGNGVSSLTLDNAGLVALLGGAEADFILRLKTKATGMEFILSSEPRTLAVKLL